MLRPLEHWNLLWHRKLRQAERNKLQEHPQITGAVARHNLRGHSLCQQRHNAPLAMTERLYRALRWTKQGVLPWLLLGLLVCAPIVRAQIVGFDRQAVEIFGTVFVEGRNRPIGGAIVNIRSLTVTAFRASSQGRQLFTCAMDRLLGFCAGTENTGKGAQCV